MSLSSAEIEEYNKRLEELRVELKGLVDDCNYGVITAEDVMRRSYKLYCEYNQILAVLDLENLFD